MFCWKYLEFTPPRMKRPLLVPLPRFSVVTLLSTPGVPAVPVSCRVPLRTSVKPVWVFAPLRTMVPVPSLVRLVRVDASSTPPDTVSGLAL